MLPVLLYFTILFPDCQREISNSHRKSKIFLNVFFHFEKGFGKSRFLPKSGVSGGFDNRTLLEYNTYIIMGEVSPAEKMKKEFFSNAC